VERRTDTARGCGGIAGLVDLEAAHAFRGEIGEVEGARDALRASGGRVARDGADVRRRKLAAIQRHEIEAGAEAAHRDGAAFAVDTVDGHAGDALQRLREIGVRKLADVFGGNRVDHAGGVALGFHRRLQAAADTGNGYFLELFRLLLVGKYGVDQHRTTHDGEQCP